MTQQYSLRWNNHQPNFISMFTTLLNTQTLVDVTLSAEGKQLKAHRVVLSACSTYFQALFMDNPSQHPIVILKDVSFADLRIMVDFMYYGEVNVTEEQLPQVLNTAKLLKIKGLTEMPDTTTSVTRSQGTSADFQAPIDSVDSEMHSTSPSSSPSIKKKRRRKSSTGSTQLMVAEDNRNDDPGQSVDLMRGDAITLSSLPQQRRAREFHEDRSIDGGQQAEQHNLNVEPLGMDSNPPGLAQESSSGLKLRRSKHFRRQSRVQPDEREIRKQSSEPLPAPTPHVLQKHESYPQYTPPKNRRARTLDHEVDSLLIRAVTVIGRQSSASSPSTASTSVEGTLPETPPPHAQRASHTPAVRSGPPLSCNFCWNTVDECGRILRRKTQYHCPECRTNLCIVPCFHEYHDGPEVEAQAAASAR